jgi:hypothetical protein
MFTSMEKALVALVMAVLSILDLTFGFHFGSVSEASIAEMLGILTAILVYFVPNRGA